MEEEVTLSLLGTVGPVRYGYKQSATKKTCKDGEQISHIDFKGCNQVIL